MRISSKFRMCLFLAFLAPLLTGWVNEGPRATFTVLPNGQISTSGLGNQPNWLRTDREYENVNLTFEYRLEEWAEAAVILRAPRAGRPMRAGIAITLAHDFHNEVTPHVTGAITGARAPLARQSGTWGEWHSVSIDLRGDRLKAQIDGTTVQDVDLASDPELRHRLKRGYIGFPDLGYGYTVRNIQIEDLGSAHRYVDLFDGNSLDGWRLRGAGHWSVKDGAIVGANGHGILYASPAAQDFELTALVRSHNRANGGIFLRGSHEERQPRGFEIQIYSPVDAVYPTGSIYGRQRADLTAEYEERWFLLQIIARGPECIVRLDGVEVARYDRLPPELRKAGQVGLQIHSDNASVEWKDLRIRLSPDAGK